MATLTRIKVKNQSCGRMLGALSYVLQAKKVTYDGVRIENGVNCTPCTSYLEMMSTKQSYRKTDGVCFFHFVQSFSDEENITPWEANKIAMELANKLFPDYECVVATHTDTDNIHSHIIVNSVSFTDGKKLHMGPTSLQEQRQVNDEICQVHGLSVLEPYTGQKKKGMKPGEYRAALRCDSWKFTLIKAIEDALYYSPDKESFISNMEYEGYEVSWRKDRKYITFTCPDGQKCRDKSLHDETYLKENLEKLFEYRQATRFVPGTVEPLEGWLAPICSAKSIASDAVKLGKEIGQIGDTPPVQLPYIHTESKQKRRENLKKLAQGQKLQSEQEYGINM